MSKKPKRQPVNNPVAKHVNKFYQNFIMPDKKKYSRKQKGRRDDLFSCPVFA